MGLIREIFDDASYLYGLNNGNNYQSEKDEDREWQERMQQQQNEFNLRMWKMNNEYNSPANQIARLKAAGLSGAGAAASLNGGNSQGPITSSQQPSAPDQNNRSGLLSAILGGIKELSLLNAQRDNLEADTRVKNADANRNEQTLNYDIDILKKQSSWYDEQMNQIRTNLKLTDSQINNWEILNTYADKKNQLEINQMIANYKKTLQDIDNLKQQNANLKQDEIKQIWENYFRENFGIDPNSNPMQMLITSTLKGETDAVFNAFEKGVGVVFEHLKGIAETGKNILAEKFNESLKNKGLFNQPITWEDAKSPMLSLFKRFTNYSKDKATNFSNHIGLSKKIQRFSHDFKKGIKNHKSTNNVYGYSWNR